MATTDKPRIYVPSIPQNLSPEELPRFLFEELNRISLGLDELNSNLQIEESNAAPEKPRSGLIARADGSNWDPGSGAGPYMYYNSVWNPLFIPPTYRKVHMFQVTDDGTTSQTMTNGAVPLTGLWASPSISENSKFSFDDSTGQLTVNVTGTADFNIAVHAHNTAAARVQLHVQLQKYDTTISPNAFVALQTAWNYSHRDTSLDLGGTTINGFKLDVTSGDIFRVRAWTTGATPVVGDSNTAGSTYISCAVHEA